MNEIRRPALRYFGGKWRIAPWVISYFPEHGSYIEPCGGGASVLIQKEQSELETYNDLDSRVVNFFRVLRDQADELVQRIRLTPWSREEFEVICQAEIDDPVENARRFYALCKQSIAEPGGSWRSAYQGGRVADMEDVDHLRLIAKRFAEVQIENRDALEVVEKYAHENSLVYIDPPYVAATRTGSNYRYEMDDTYHRRIADLLRAIPGYVVISGYPSALYRELYEAQGWERYDKTATTISGASRIESVWVSPRTMEANRKPRLLRLPFE